MKTQVAGPNPITVNKYRKPTKDKIPNKILLGASFPGKKCPVPPVLPKKGPIDITTASPMRRIEAIKGKSPPPGDLKEPMG